MIKYIGSKRRLVPVLGDLLTRSGARTALDLFTGTTRVAQEFKSRGATVTAVDTARYSEIYAQCYIATDAADIEPASVEHAVDELNRLPPEDGYFTQTFCVEARYLQPKNGARVDAIRNHLEDRYKGTPLFPVLLASLLDAADRVDSTTGVQMAYLKEWAPRSFNDLELRPPALLPGSGHAIRGDALSMASELGPFDLAYLDPPYNQHRYFTNYHVWETLVAWDSPEHYGVACKRIDSRDPSTASPFNSKRAMPDALRRVIADVDAQLVVVSYNNESWVSIDELREMCAVRGDVEVLEYDSKRYVGAQIGIYNPSGAKVGQVSHLRNVEYVLVCGDQETVRAATTGP